MTQAYVCHGNVGRTYGIDDGDTVWIQTEYPSGRLGDVRELPWPLDRWTGRLGAEETDLSDVPESLRSAAGPEA